MTNINSDHPRRFDTDFSDVDFIKVKFVNTDRYESMHFLFNAGENKSLYQDGLKGKSPSDLPQDLQDEINSGTVNATLEDGTAIELSWCEDEKVWYDEHGNEYDVCVDVYDDGSYHIYASPKKV